jgi:hypothetical protein
VARFCTHPDAPRIGGEGRDHHVRDRPFEKRTEKL